MVEILTPPVDHDLNRVTQAVLVSGSYAIWLGFLVYTVLIGRKERTPFYTFIVMAAAVGGYVEPLYDNALMLYFYTPGMWKTFTAFDIPQPMWVYSGYVTLYASVAVFLTRDIQRGITRAKWYKYAISELLTSCIFEMIGINGGAYEYWGPHVFRIFKYPLCIGVLEMAQVMVFSTVCANVRARATSWPALLTIFFVFPFTMVGSNAGIGSPLIVALHSSNPTEAVVTVGSLLCIAFACVVVWGAYFFLPSEGKIALEESNGHARYTDGEDA
ncbi:MAG: hypothetical protein M1819_005869 [Sarea resinae]|nr:MAG: hypothetical protein M1819_005869 [Sarea resinae]